MKNTCLLIVNLWKDLTKTKSLSSKKIKATSQCFICQNRTCFHLPVRTPSFWRTWKGNEFSILKLEQIVNPLRQEILLPLLKMFEFSSAQEVQPEIAWKQTVRQSSQDAHVDNLLCFHPPPPLSLRFFGLDNFLCVSISYYRHNVQLERHLTTSTPVHI